MDIRAEMDLLVALSACPDLAVGGKPVDVRFTSLKKAPFLILERKGETSYFLDRDRGDALRRFEFGKLSQASRICVDCAVDWWQRSMQTSSIGPLRPGGLRQRRRTGNQAAQEGIQRTLQEPELLAISSKSAPPMKPRWRKNQPASRTPAGREHHGLYRVAQRRER
jgi:hypothetical protein